MDIYGLTVMQRTFKNFQKSGDYFQKKSIYI